MKNNYVTALLKKLLFLTGVFLYLISGTVTAQNAQVIKPFTQRTSQHSPDKKIYNLRGDFVLLGNTNLTLQYYGDNRGNNAQMKYVDVDNDRNTWNSSSADLVLSSENGADPSCSNIVYAGLYWTGRSHDGGWSPEEFTVGS